MRSLMNLKHIVVLFAGWEYHRITAKNDGYGTFKRMNTAMEKETVGLLEIDNTY